MIELAIDFGGSNTSIYEKNSGLVLKEPTLIAVLKQNYDIRGFGIDAKKLQGKTDENTIIFSPIVDGVIKSKEYAVVLLKYFLRKIFESGHKRASALVCVPCGLNRSEMRQYFDVFYAAGFRKIKIVPRIICAALGSGINISSEESSFVVDIGGSVTDIASINFNSVVRGSTTSIGGKSMDLAITNAIVENYGIVIGLATAQKIKEEIASLSTTEIRRFELVGLDAGNKNPRTAIISSQSIYSAIISFFDDIIKIIQTTINDSPPEVSADILRHGIYICGGVSQIPELEAYFNKKLGIPIIIADYGDNTAIVGAGLLLHNQKLLEQVIKEM